MLFSRKTLLQHFHNNDVSYKFIDQIINKNTITKYDFDYVIKTNRITKN